VRRIRQGKVTHYRNGKAIPKATGNSEWSKLNKGAFSNYDNNASNAATYGRLYNWYAVNDKQGIAPEGWHVPSNAEWQILIDYLGGEDIAGSKLKEVGSEHWYCDKANGTNEVGFCALPGGFRDGNWDIFTNIRGGANFWSSLDEDSGDNAWTFRLGCTSLDIKRTTCAKTYGLSIRCVKD